MMKLVATILILVDTTHAFHSLNTFPRRSVMYMNGHDSNKKNQAISGAVNFAKSAALISATLGLILNFNILNANALGSLEDANSKLSDYGLPPILYVPDGFSPVVSEFGRGNIKTSINNPIVQFCAPQLWVIEKTNVNNNGESGKIAANDYQKGDSAFLFNYALGEGEKIEAGNKDLFQKILLKSVNQKGDMTESFKITDIKPGAKETDGQAYVIVDFQYKINTEAGFLVSRKGVASFTNVGPDSQVMVAVTTDKRYKDGLETKLRNIASTFRVNKLNSGVFATSQ